jgi:hypothetical protein
MSQQSSLTQSAHSVRQVLTELHPLPALFGKQVAFTAVYVQVLEHGAPAPQMLNSLIIRRIRTLDE